MDTLKRCYTPNEINGDIEKVKTRLGDAYTDFVEPIKQKLQIEFPDFNDCVESGQVKIAPTMALLLAIAVVKMLVL